MFEHTFYKNATPVVKESIAKVFGELEPVSKMRPNRFELPITSVRRILGDDFWKMEGPDDILNLIVFEDGSLNINALEVNLHMLNEFIQFLNTIFQTINDINSGNPVTKEFMEKPIAKMCVTSSTCGLQSFEVALKDFSPICTFDNNGIIDGMLNMREVAEIAMQIESNKKAIANMQNTGNGQAIEALQKTHTEYIKRYKTLQLEVVSRFKEIIGKYAGYDSDEDDPENVYDISCIFSAEIENPKNKQETIHVTSVIQYHNGASTNVKRLKEIFKL